jgi:hypothetical protein
MGRPATPSNAQWDELRAASDLEHYAPQAITTLDGTTFTMAYSQHYYSVHLITLSNPNAVSAKKPARESAIEMPDVLRASVHKQFVMLETLQAGRYTVSFYTTGGRKISEAMVNGPGNASIPIPEMPTGAFVMKCVGANSSFVKQIVVAR